ncbi:hypothetical protein [Rhizobium sp. NXC24]|uniref:hypothetical protein n=1 Tax=Rhizobium sp. NXC24 TaxID=2048897 RepID=UPI000CF265D6|nr:hypothetical protein [Rhizobium sp. NXC24]
MKIHSLTVCDFVRREDNGKFIIIGAYTNEIIFSSLPSPFFLSLWFLLEHEKVGVDKIALRGVLGGQAEPVFFIEGEVDVIDTSNWSPMALGTGITILEPGTLTIDAKLGDEDWETVRELRITMGPIFSTGGSGPS